MKRDERHYYLEKSKLAYLVTKKCGCTSILRALLYLHDRQAFKRLDVPTDIHVNSELLPHTNDPHDPRLVEYFKFTFVRNPYERFVSFYANKIEPKIKPEYWPYDTYGFEIGMDFESAVEVLMQQGNGRIDEHMKKLVDVLLPEGMLCVDFIGRFERFAADWERLRNMTKLKLPVFHDNRWAKSRRWQDYYTTQTAARVYEFYCEDFVFLNYPREING